jgi:NAD(P)H-nitrite reductase large subunit
MDDDDEICLCFHVTKRKVLNYLRVERPKRAAQLSDCFGAGTGCGWCRPFLQKMFDDMSQGRSNKSQLPGREEYSRQRTCYVRTGGGTPPAGATPLDDQ